MPILPPRFAQRAGRGGIWNSLSQPDRSVTVEETETAADACGIREPSVKQRYTLDSTSGNRQRGRDRVNPAQLERFAPGREAGAAHLRHQPFARDPISFRTCP